MGANICRKDLEIYLTTGTPIVLIEALGAGFFADAHLPGALNLPPAQATSLAPILLHDLEAIIVVYGSASGENAFIVAGQLEALGYCDVRIYQAGKEDWVEHGLPVERSNAFD